MREQEVRELYEAYRQVHQPQEEVEQLDENIQGALEAGAKFMQTNPVGKAIGAVLSPVGSGRKTPTKGSGGYRPVVKSVANEETDLFDTILEHLVAEGYADTNEAALAIMANMSEEWRESIINESLLDVVRGVGKVAGNVAKDVKDRVTGKKELIGGPQGYVKVGGPSKPGDVKVSGIGPVGTYGKRTTPTGTNSPAATMSMRAR